MTRRDVLIAVGLVLSAIVLVTGFWVWQNKGPDFLDNRVWIRFREELNTENVMEIKAGYLDQLKVLSQEERNTVLGMLQEATYEKSFRRLFFTPGTPEILISLAFSDGREEWLEFWPQGSFLMSPNHIDSKSLFFVKHEALGRWVKEFVE
jgi:hypothetical protein